MSGVTSRNTSKCLVVCVQVIPDGAIFRKEVRYLIIIACVYNQSYITVALVCAIEAMLFVSYLYWLG